MSDIFISYANEDRAETKKLAHALESQGLSVSWERSISAGQNFAEVIEAALDEAQCVIVIWSKTSVKSDWVHAEVAEARRQEKLFPLNIDGSKPPLIYRILQTADFSRWSSATTDPVFKQLMTDIRHHIGEPKPKKKFDSEVNEKSSSSSVKLIQPVNSEPIANSKTHSKNRESEKVRINPTTILYNEQTSDIFISYSREDRVRVKPLVEALQNACGWSVWWDDRIPAGKTFDAVIDAALDRTRCVIVVWSKTSVNSDWVWEEADEGKKKGILVPIFIDKVKFPRGFRRIEAANFLDWNGSADAEAFHKLRTDLADVLGEP